MVTANQSVASALPEVVDRLDSLQALHEQSLQFSKTLLQLDNLQQKLSTNLSSNEKILQDTQAKFSHNLETIQKNFDAMDQRLNKLKKWIQKCFSIRLFLIQILYWEIHFHSLWPDPLVFDMLNTQTWKSSKITMPMLLF